MKKRGQITFVIVLGVLLLMIFGLLYFSYSFLGEQGQRDIGKGSVADYITECLSITSKNALGVLGIQGGYTKLEAPYFMDLGTAYLYDGTNKVPSVFEVEIQLGRFVNENIDKCLNSFADFEGVSVENGVPSTSVSIGEVDVTFVMSYHITIIKGDSRITVEEFIASERLNLKKILWLADSIVQSQVDYGMVDIDALKSDLQVVLFPYEKTLIAQIADDSYTKIGNKAYVFRFANKDLAIS
jgi:hypothetical protein